MQYIWPVVIGLYVIGAVATFWPCWRALRAQVVGDDVKKSIETAHAAFDGAPQFNDEHAARLSKHYDRLAGTLIFWKVAYKRTFKFSAQTSSDTSE